MRDQRTGRHVFLHDRRRLAFESRAGREAEPAATPSGSPDSDVRDPDDRRDQES